MRHLLDFAKYIVALDAHAPAFDRLRDLMLAAGPPWSGNYMFTTPEQPDEPLTYNKQVNLWNIASRPGVSRVLEVGFNAGHSAAICLMAKPGTTVEAFDIAEFAYTRPCALFLSHEAFPGRLRLTVGDSMRTLPDYVARAEGTFDLVHIDGCHTYEHVRSDLRHALRLCHADTVVLVDDFHGGIQRAAEECVADGLMRPHPDIVLHPMPAWPHAVFQAVPVAEEAEAATA